MNWTADYIGLIFRSKGRERRSGVDCWGLVKLVYQQKLNIELPSYGEIDAHDLIRVTREIDAGKDGETWSHIENDQLQEFDVCVMKYQGTKRIGHVGLVTPDHKILHIEQGCNAVIVPLSHPTIRGRISCFRRHRQAAKS